MKASTEKAVTGPGVYSMMYADPIWSRKRDDAAFFKQAQALYHSHPWVGTAENTISTRVASVRWHLEDDNDDEVTDESGEELRRIRDLLEKPLGDVRELIKEVGFKPASPSTGRELRKITSRHMGLCGVGAWFLDELDGAAKTPKRIFYLNPARLTPAGANGNLTGWVLDHQGYEGSGTPLDLDEVLLLVLDPPDTGHFGIGWVERMLVKAQLTDLADRHGGGVLATGGRLAGTVSPRNIDTWLTNDQYDELVASFRAINEHPDASKRTLVLKGAVEFTPNAANPEQLQLVEFAQMGRDDILAGAGVPYSQIGGTSPAGFGGEVRSAEEAALWAGACGPRLDALMEHVQFGLLDRWKTLGVNVELKDARPSFDDDKPKYETAALARTMPMRNDERRALIGLDPFDDEELNAMVYIPSDLVRIDVPPEPKNPTPPALLPFTGEPVMEPEPMMDMEPVDNLPESVKAQMSWTPAMRKAVQKVLDEQRVEIAGKVREKAAHLAREPKDSTVWWNGAKWDKRLTEALTPYAEAIAESTQEAIGKKLASRKKGKAAGDVLARIVKSLATRVRGINETTRDKIRNLVEQHALTPGIGAQELGQYIEDATAFTADRAELVARTESAHYLNESQLATFEEYGVEKVEAIDGDDDPECAERNGTVYTLEEAAAIEDHPNGTLDWAPVLA